MWMTLSQVKGIEKTFQANESKKQAGVADLISDQKKKKPQTKNHQYKEGHCIYTQKKKKKKSAKNTGKFLASMCQTQGCSS